MIDSFLNYIKHEKRYSKNTFSSYQSDLLQFELFLKENNEVKSIQEADYNLIRAWVVELSNQEINPNSINRKIATLKSYFKFMLRKGFLQSNPAARIKPLKVAKQNPDFIDESLLLQLLDNLRFEQNFSGLRDRLILEFLYATGIRLDELIKLQDKDIDLHSQTVKVLGKRKKERIIPFHHPLSALITAYQEARNLHFGIHEEGWFMLTDEGNATYPSFIYLTVKRYLGLITSQDKRSPHTLRHSFATHLLNKGADINAIKELLGHTSLSATQVYTHNSLDKLKAIFDQAHPKA